MAEFESHRPAAIVVEVDVNLVLVMRPQWSKERATSFLRRHANAIAGMMANAGGLALNAMLTQDEKEIQ